MNSMQVWRGRDSCGWGWGKLEADVLEQAKPVKEAKAEEPAKEPNQEPYLAAILGLMTYEAMARHLPPGEQ